MSQKQKKHKPEPASYRDRNYRSFVDSEGLISFEIRVRETDLHILTTKDLSAEALHHVFGLRNQLENYIAANPHFLKSLHPLPPDSLAPAIVREMIWAAEKAGVGPMAAVAGVTAQLVGEALALEHGLCEIVVENGGDIYLRRDHDCTIAIFAGSSPLSNKVGVCVNRELMPLGVCTSSASVGHSLSFGQADAVTVLAKSTALADAVATRLGNEAKKPSDVKRVIEIGQAIEGVCGIVVIYGDKLGAWGDLELKGL